MGPRGRGRRRGYEPLQFPQRLFGGGAGLGRYITALLYQEAVERSVRLRCWLHGVSVPLSAGDRLVQSGPACPIAQGCATRQDVLSRYRDALLHAVRALLATAVARARGDARESAFAALLGAVRHPWAHPPPHGLPAELVRGQATCRTCRPPLRVVRVTVPAPALSYGAQGFVIAGSLSLLEIPGSLLGGVALCHDRLLEIGPCAHAIGPATEEEDRPVQRSGSRRATADGGMVRAVTGPVHLFSRAVPGAGRRAAGVRAGRRRGRPPLLAARPPGRLGRRPVVGPGSAGAASRCRW